MDSHQRWLADFKKEVDEVLETLRASKAGQPQASAADGAHGLPGQFEGLKSARVEFARLEFLVEDLQGKLSSRTLQFETEQKTRDRLKERVGELTEQVRTLEEKAAAFRRESMAHSEEAKELDETLRVTMQARAQLVSALEDEKRQMESWMGESKALKAKLDNMDSLLNQKEASLHETQARYEEACKAFASDTAELHKEIARLSGEMEKARVHESESQARIEAARHNIEAERERVQAESSRTTERAEASQRTAAEAVARATERAEASQRTAAEAVARATETRNRIETEAAEIHKSLDVEREHLRRELEKHHANMEDAYGRLESERAELEAERHHKQIDASRASEEAQALRRQGVEALEEARKLKTAVEAEADRLHAEVRSEMQKSSEIRSMAEAEMKKALVLEKELLRKNEGELAAAKAELDLEREELLTELESERGRIKRQSVDEIELQHAAIRAELAEEFRLHRMHAEQGLKREAILKGSDSRPHLPEPSPASVPSAPASLPPSPGAAPERAPAEGASWLGRKGLAAAGLAVLAAWAASALLGRDQVVRHEVPFSHPTALVWNRGELWAADWYDAAIFRMRLSEGKLEVLNRYPLPGSHITGLAVGEGILYAADSWKKDISLLKVQGDKLVLQKSWPSPGPSPSALFLEGSFLYSGDGWGQRVYKHAADDDLTVLQSWKVGFAPSAVLPAADYFWTADGEGRRVYSHRLGTDLSVDSGWSLPELDKGREPLSCMGRSGERFWFGRDGSKVLLEAARSRLKREAPKN